MKLLRGKWIQTHKSKAFDVVIGIATKGAASDWCRLYGLNVEASFSLAKYGEDSCRILAMQWCKVNQHYFDIYKSQEEPEHIYSDAELASFQEDIDWVDFVLASGPESAVWARAHLIRHLKPSLRPVSSSTGKASSSSKSSK